MTTASPLAIEATGLVKTFDETRPVDGVDLAVSSGSVYGGARSQRRRQDHDDPHARHAHRPDAGSARVLGHDIVKESDAFRAAVSLTGQLASVDQDLTAART
jgi:ABC-2 type transport system ATP-binding protein